MKKDSTNLMQTNLGLILFGFGILFALSCSLDTPSQIPRNNPLDAQNPDTHGDPYRLTAELADGGVRLVWHKVDFPPLIGYSIYR